MLVLFGFGLLTLAGIVLNADPLLILTTLCFVLVLVFSVGAYRVWDATDRLLHEDAGASLAGPAALSTELQLTRALKTGRQIGKEMGDPLVGRLQAVNVEPWTRGVEQILNQEDPELARRFIEADEGTPVWNPILVSKQVSAVMGRRLDALESIVEELRSPGRRPVQRSITGGYVDGRLREKQTSRARKHNARAQRPAYRLAPIAIARSRRRGYRFSRLRTKPSA